MKDGPLLEWVEKDGIRAIMPFGNYEVRQCSPLLPNNLYYAHFAHMKDGLIEIEYLATDDFGLPKQFDSREEAIQACEDHARAELEKLAHYFEPQEGKIEFTGDVLEWEGFESTLDLYKNYTIGWIDYIVRRKNGFFYGIAEKSIDNSRIICSSPCKLLDEAKQACETHARNQLIKLLSEAPIRIKPDEPVTGKDCKWRDDRVIRPRCLCPGCPMEGNICPDNFGCTCAERKDGEDEK